MTPGPTTLASRRLLSSEAQGLPWERHLAGRGDLGDWIAERAPNFKTFDFYDPRTQVATSAKTLDTRAVSYVREPRRVFATLKRYIDSIYNFESYAIGEFVIPAAIIERRSFELAVPAASTSKQMSEINRARTYAESLGVNMKVVLIR